MKKQKIAVIGGGITGLSAAYLLQKEMSLGNLDAEVNLYEASNRLGGSIQTDYRDGFVIEKGPDSFLTRKRSIYELARELDLEAELVTNKTGSYILHNNKLHKIPQGAVMGIPTQWKPFLTTGLFSVKGKMRAALDMILPRGSRSEDDVSVGSFFRRRLGHEVVDHMIEPLLSGIYAGNIDKLSLKATFPQFLEVERNHRSLILGMKESQKVKKDVPPILLGADKKPAGMFLTFRGGLQSFTDKLAAQLAEENVHLEKKLLKLEKWENGYRLSFQDGRVEYADKILLTTRHQQAYELLKDHAFISPLGRVPATSVATVALSYDTSALKSQLEGTGFLVPKSAGYTITACTWTHQKWEHTAPEGKALLRAYVGRAGDDEIVNESDENIVKAVQEDLKKIMGIQAPPLFSIVTRWHQAMPQYEVNHKAKLDQIDKELQIHFPGVQLIGASYQGIGLPDCVNQAKKAVDQIVG